MIPPVASPTFTVLMVPLPVTVPWVRVTTGVAATLLVCRSFAPLPLMVMPLLALTAPLPLRVRVPSETSVAPV